MVGQGDEGPDSFDLKKKILWYPLAPPYLLLFPPVVVGSFCLARRSQEKPGGGTEEQGRPGGSGAR